MLYGHVETDEDRVDHILQLRELQDETGGFTAFIPLAFHPDNSQMADVPASLRTCPGGMGKAVFHRVLEDFLTLFPYELSWLAVLWREWAICAEPRVALHNCGLRLRGILRPGRGLPDGVSLKP